MWTGIITSYTGAPEGIVGFWRLKEIVLVDKGKQTSRFSFSIQYNGIITYKIRIERYSDELQPQQHYNHNKFSVIFMFESILNGMHFTVEISRGGRAGHNTK